MQWRDQNPTDAARQAGFGVLIHHFQLTAFGHNMIMCIFGALHGHIACFACRIIADNFAAQYFLTRRPQLPVDTFAHRPDRAQRGQPDFVFMAVGQQQAQSGRAHQQIVCFNLEQKLHNFSL